MIGILKRWAVPLSVLMFLVFVGAVARMMYGIAVIDFLLGLSVFILIIHVVTLDDYLPGGWSNPDGDETMPSLEKWVLFLKVVIILALLGVKFFLIS